MQEVQIAAQNLMPVIQGAFIFGIAIAVIIAAGKLGFKLAPYILVGAALLYFFGG